MLFLNMGLGASDGHMWLRKEYRTKQRKMAE
jgi:hypothetical protein